jgi:hypothetical protein
MRMAVDIALVLEDKTDVMVAVDSVVVDEGTVLHPVEQVYELLRLINSQHRAAVGCCYDHMQTLPSENILA